MKSLIKILCSSLLAITIVGAASGIANCADTIKEALKNGDISGEAKIWYQTNDRESEGIFEKENSWFDAGLRLSYVTDTYMNFKAGVSYYALDDLGAYKKFADRSMMGVDHSETDTWLGEAWISYKFRNTLAKIGRQNIKSPLVDSDSWAIFPSNFEGVLIKNTDIQNTTLLAACITEERWRGNEDFEDFHDDLLMFGVVNKSIPDTSLSAYIYIADDDMGNTENDDDTKVAYLEAKTKISNINLAFQYIGIDPEAKGADSTNAFGSKISVNLGMVELAATYSYVSDGYYEAAKLSDNRTKTPLYTSTLSGDGDISGRPDTQSAMLSIAVTPIDKLKVILKHGYYNFDSANNYRKTAEREPNDDDASTTELICKYTGIDNVAMFGALNYSDHEGIGAWNGQNGDDLITFRFWAKYSF